MLTAHAANPAPADAAPAQDDTRPLSTAQVALFDTPHLKNVEKPETLDYSFVRVGPKPFTDKVSVTIKTIHPDGTKYVSFDFLTGSNHQFFPAVDNFSGNPLLMTFLEHDVDELRDMTGVAAAWYRDRIRDALIDQAVVSDTEVTVGGKKVPARLITLKPFAHNDRLEKLPTMQQKEYRFVLSDQVPGEIAEMSTAIPADDKAGLPALTETISFTGESK